MNKLLIVDHNNELRQKIKEILADRLKMTQILEASNAEQADSIIEKNRPDVILTDLKLPGNEGFWLLKRTKLRHPKIPIIINSFLDTAEYRSAAFQLGANYFLSKETNNLNDMVAIIQTLS